MAILIDMPTPTTCNNCKLFNSTPNGLYPYSCRVTWKKVEPFLKSRPNWCPLREMVKCKDCKHWGQDGYKEGCKYMMCIVAENDWCSFEERREE